MDTISRWIEEIERQRSLSLDPDYSEESQQEYHQARAETKINSKDVGELSVDFVANGGYWFVLSFHLTVLCIMC